MNEFEMSDYIDGAREMVFMAMDEHGILCEELGGIARESMFSTWCLLKLLLSP